MERGVPELEGLGWVLEGERIVLFGRGQDVSQAAVPVEAL
jgi:hypothetical protein